MLERELLGAHLRRGLLPPGPAAQVPDGLFSPPPVVEGEAADPRDWERAIVELERALSATEEVLRRIRAQDAAGQWREVERVLGGLETACRVAATGRGSGRAVYTFSHIPHIADVPADNLPRSSCEVDFERQCATLRQEDGWCSKLNLSGSRVFWYVEPRDCRVTQYGSAQDIVEENGRSWALAISGNSRVALRVEVTFPSPVECNAVRLDVAGRIDETAVLVDGEPVAAVDRRATWFAFPRRTASRLEVVLAKNSYDSDAGMTHFFCLREISVHLHRYRRHGVYVSHAVEVDGVEACAALELGLPEGSSAETYLGFQVGREVEWRRVDSGQWVALPWLDRHVEERFTVSTRSAPAGNGLYEVYRFEDEPVLSSIELYPAFNMWKVEWVPAGGSATPTLQSWVERASAAAPAGRLLDMSAGLKLQGGMMYRFSAYVYVGPDDAGKIEKWKPGAAGAQYSVYVNWMEQVPENDHYNLLFRPGWNLVEIIAASEQEAFFDPLLYPEEAASVACAVRGPAKLVSLDDLRSGGLQGLEAATYYQRALYVSYLPSGEDFVRFLCRYYTKREDRIFARLMVAMTSATGDTSPVLSGFAVKWR